MTRMMRGVQRQRFNQDVLQSARAVAFIRVVPQDRFYVPPVDGRQGGIERQRITIRDEFNRYVEF